MKQTLMRSLGLNGRPAASRLSGTRWYECFAGMVIFPVGTSVREKLRPRGTVGQLTRLLLPTLASGVAVLRASFRLFAAIRALWESPASLVGGILSATMRIARTHNCSLA